MRALLSAACIVAVMGGVHAQAINPPSALGLGATPITGGTTGRVLYDNAGMIGEYAISGTGSVCMTTSCTLVTPALGTPASGVATNLTGTAAGLTAGNVTTNANLTGPITSVGNATSIASQTGTGTKFVVDTSPTLVTPVLGVATGTSLGLGGAAIGKMTIATPDLATAPSLSIRQAVDTTFGYDFRSDDANGILRLDTVNSSVFSTNPSLTIKRSTGNVGIGTNAPGKQLDVVGTFRASTEVTMLSLTAASGTPSSICQNAATKEVTVNAALTCTVSGRQFKHDINPIAMSALDLIRAIEPVAFIYNDSSRPRWGFIAEQVAGVDRKFGDAWDGDVPKSIDQNAILAVVVKALQELKADNDNLRHELSQPRAKLKASD